MSETTVAADAVPPVAVPDADAAPSVRPAASPATRRRPRVAAKRSHLIGGTFPSVALAVVSGLLGVVLGYALGLRRGKKRGEAEEGAAAEPNTPRPLTLTPTTSPGPTLASPARAKRAPPRPAGGKRAEENVLAERENGQSMPVSTPPPAKRPTESSWTLSDFLAFADVKLGKPNGPVARWSVEGDVFEYPTGRRLAKVLGVDVCRRVDEPLSALRDVVLNGDSEDSDESTTTIVQMSRKLLLFLDPETDEVMTHFEGRSVSPAAFPYQIVEYAFSTEKSRSSNLRFSAENDDPNRTTANRGSVTATVTVGSGSQKMTLTGASVLVSKGPTYYANDKNETNDLKNKSSRVFSVPAFLDVETEDGTRHEAYESYDYFGGLSQEDLNRGGSTNDNNPNKQPPVFTWTRFGACAPFGEACVLRALAFRVATHEDLPKAVKKYVEKKEPLYADAPKDAAEIMELQR